MASEYVVIPPDGGWGWVVVFASFYCQMVLDGIMLSFAMILSDVAEYYKTTQSYAACIGSVMFGMHYLAGPICAILSFMYGEMAVCVFGSILTAAGFAVVYFDPPLFVLIISAGFFGGIGMCFLNMNTIVMTTLYFSKRRILALGIVVCGTGAGTIVFTLLAYVTKEQWGWKGVCFIHAGFSLSMAVASLTLRPLEPRLVQTELSKPSSGKIQMELVDVNLPENDDVNAQEEATVYYVRDPENLQQPSSQFEDETGQVLEDIAVQITHPIMIRRSRRKAIMRCICLRFKRKNQVNTVNRDSVFHNTGVRRMTVDDLRLTKRNICEKCSRHFSKVFHDHHILTSFPFNLFCLSGALTASAILIIFYYEKTLILTDGGTESDATWYLMYLGAVNVIFRFGLGLISMLPKINYQTVHFIGLILGGAATAMTSLSESLYYDYFSGALCCFAIACNAVYLPIERLSLVGMKHISFATGVSMLLMGVFSAIGAPLAGLAMEATQSYHVTYYIAGGMLIISGILLMMVKYGFKNRLD